MRHIVLLAPSAAISAREAGLVCRFVVGALLLSHGVRRDVRLDLCFDEEKCISFDGNSMRNVRPDEQSLSGILKAGLRRLDQSGEGRVMQGINAYISTIEELLTASKGTKLYYSGKGGTTTNLSGGFTAFFQFPALEEAVAGELQKIGYKAIGLGKCLLSPDQAVVVLNNHADRSTPP